MSYRTACVRPARPASQAAGFTARVSLNTLNCLRAAAGCPAFGFFERGAKPPQAANGSSSPDSIPSREPRSRQLQKKPLALGPGQFFTEQYRKDLIVLHFTAGASCESAYRTWEGNAERIGTAFGVDPDGTIVEFFPPECWAYHLGVKGTHRHDRRSIGIEIANVGPLKPDGADPSRLNWWPNNWGARYCALDEGGRYHRASFRGIHYFASMPEIQQQAVGSLVRELCERFSIPRIASPSARSGEFDPQAFGSYAGVATHTNFRRDKWDVGPAFNWDYLGF